MPSAPSLDPERYELDDDGLPREIVGPWVRDKHLRLRKYVDISRGVRAGWIGPGKAGATYVDLFSGPGRARIRDTTDVVDGSPIAAWITSRNGGAPFSEIHIADGNAEFVNACATRLRTQGANVSSEIGEATVTIDRIISRLNPYGLHFAFLDPYNLGSLSFDIIRKLAKFRRMDILLHVSTMDLQMNLRTYMEREASSLDAFAPGWREKVDTMRSNELVRGKILEHWRGLLKAEGMDTTESPELVVGTSNQRLYWLAFVARHERALEFWEKIRDVDKQGKLL